MRFQAKQRVAERVARVGDLRDFRGNRRTGGEELAGEDARLELGDGARGEDGVSVDAFVLDRPAIGPDLRGVFLGGLLNQWPGLLGFPGVDDRVADLRERRHARRVVLGLASEEAQARDAREFPGFIEERLRLEELGGEPGTAAEPGRTRLRVGDQAVVFGLVAREQGRQVVIKLLPSGDGLEVAERGSVTFGVLPSFSASSISSFAS